MALVEIPFVNNKLIAMFPFDSDPLYVELENSTVTLPK